MIRQTEFFEQIMVRAHNRSQTIEEIADILHISVSAVRKIMQGHTELSYERLRKLIDHFQICPEELFTPRKNIINATYVSLDVQEPDNYLRYINGLLGAIATAATDPASKIMFAADDIPIFHFMRSKRLTYFKLFYYGYSMHKYDCKFEHMEKTFDGLGLMPIFEQIVSHYDSMHTIEIWDDYIIDSLCDQIYFMHGVDAFDQTGTADELIAELRTLVNGVAQLCDTGEKARGGKFEFLRRASRISPGYMLTETSKAMHLNIKLASINSLAITNGLIIAEMYKNFLAAMDMSIPFGVGVKREQKIYFKNLLKRTMELETNIKNGLP